MVKLQPRSWTEEEDLLLIALKLKYPESTYRELTVYFRERSDSSLRHRWNDHLCREMQKHDEKWRDEGKYDLYNSILEDIDKDMDTIRAQISKKSKKDVNREIHSLRKARIDSCLPRKRKEFELQQSIKYEKKRDKKSRIKLQEVTDKSDFIKSGIIVEEHKTKKESKGEFESKPKITLKEFLTSQ